jgi:hypothetical protein
MVMMFLNRSITGLLAKIKLIATTEIWLKEALLIINAYSNVYLKTRLRIPK